MMVEVRDSDDSLVFSYDTGKSSECLFPARARVNEVSDALAQAYLFLTGAASLKLEFPPEDLSLVTGEKPDDPELVQRAKVLEARRDALFDAADERDGLVITGSFRLQHCDLELGRRLADLEASISGHERNTSEAERGFGSLET